MKKEGSLSAFPSSLLASSMEITCLEIVTLSQTLLREVGAMQTDKVTSNSGIDLAKEIESYEVSLIRSALMQSGGRQRQAARLLNVKTSTLNSKIKRYRIFEKTKIVF